jgi:arabinofuranosyltransferase
MSEDPALDAPGQRSRRQLGLIFQGLAALTVAIGVGLWSQHRYVLDDAFISYRYARHLVEGLGPVFNAGERVEGYTNALWMLLNAAALALGLDPLVTSQVLGLSCFGLTVFVAAGLIAPLLTRWPALILAAPLLALGVTAHFVDFAASGLESGLWGLCVLALGRQLVAPPGRSRAALSTNALCLALLLTRLDGAPFVAVHVLVTARQTFVAHDEPGRLRAVGRQLLLSYGPFTLAFAVYLATKYAYYGSVLPNTFQAKSAGAESLGSGLAYLRGFLLGYPALSLAVPLAALGALRAPRPELARFGHWAGASLLLYYGYLAAVGGDFMMYRLALQPYATLLVLAALGLSRLLERRTAPALVCALALLGLAPGRPQVEHTYYMQSMEEMHRYFGLGREVGLALKRALPPDTIISTTLAGGVPYFSELTAIDQLGLNDRWVALHGKHFPRSRGHTRRAPVQYLADRGVQLVFDHPASSPCARLRSKAQSRVFVRIDATRCVGAEYLVRSPELTVHLCQHPEWFVLDRVRCPDNTTLHGLQLLDSQLQRSVAAPARVDASGKAVRSAPTGFRGALLRSRRQRASAPKPSAVR